MRAAAAFASRSARVAPTAAGCRGVRQLVRQQGVSGRVPGRSGSRGERDVLAQRERRASLRRANSARWRRRGSGRRAGHRPPRAPSGCERPRRGGSPAQARGDRRRLAGGRRRRLGSDALEQRPLRLPGRRRSGNCSGMPVSWPVSRQRTTASRHAGLDRGGEPWGSARPHPRSAGWRARRVRRLRSVRRRATPRGKGGPGRSCLPAPARRRRPTDALLQPRHEGSAPPPGQVRAVRGRRRGLQTALARRAPRPLLPPSPAAGRGRSSPPAPTPVPRPHRAAARTRPAGVGVRLRRHRRVAPPPCPMAPAPPNEPPNPSATRSGRPGSPPAPPPPRRRSP